MADARMTAAAIGGPPSTHFMSPFIPASRGGVVLCASTALSTPATSDERYVNCSACLALMTPEQRAIQEEQRRRYPSGGGM